jgi:hypothetical protein
VLRKHLAGGPVLGSRIWPGCSCVHHDQKWVPRGLAVFETRVMMDRDVSAFSEKLMRGRARRSL